MARVWQVVARRTAPVLGGAGARVGLCPGPALAPLTFGGRGGVAFICAMAAGMLVAPMLRGAIGLPAPSEQQRTAMDIRALTPTYAVSPQIEPADLAAIKAAGFTTIIDNRPDGEIPPHLHAAQMHTAATALGLTFVSNPVVGGALTTQNVTAQAAAVAAATGPVLAYCASGNRSSVVWALLNAGTRPTNDLISIPARFGYNLEHLRGQLDAKSAG